MATATYPGAAGNTALTEAATFVPEIWSDEIIASYQKNLEDGSPCQAYCYEWQEG